MTLESQPAEDAITSMSLVHLKSLTRLTLLDGAMAALNKGLLYGGPHDGDDDVDPLEDWVAASGPR